jgi:hypothetical protein
MAWMMWGGGAVQMNMSECATNTRRMYLGNLRHPLPAVAQKERHIPTFHRILLLGN